MEEKTTTTEEEMSAPGWDAITAECERSYPD